MWATFCDDVRQEVGNKLSYLGVYGSNLVVPFLPTTLLKLCCVLNVRVPASLPPRKVVFKLLRGEQSIYEVDLSPAGGHESLMDVPADRAESHIITITTIAQLLTFEITEPTTLRTHAIVDGKELRGNALELQVAPGPRTK
jgi:hypothetical protein